MDSVNDNPLKRWSSAWLGTIIFAIFGVLGVALAMLFDDGDKNSFDSAQKKRRHEILNAVEKEQEGTKEKIAASFAKVGGELLAIETAAVEDKKWKLPTAPPDPIDPAVLAKGKDAYTTCVICHGPEGEGMPNLGPPLAGSEWVLGPAENLIRIQLRGLIGPIEVAGKLYTPVAPMPPQLAQDDETVAAVLTFVRNSFGNQAEMVTPDAVKALRGEMGKPMLKAEDLIPPK